MCAYKYSLFGFVQLCMYVCCGQRLFCMEGMDVLIDYDHLVVRPRASLILIHTVSLYIAEHY